MKDNNKNSADSSSSENDVEVLRKKLYNSVQQNLKLLSILEIGRVANNVLTLEENLFQICSQIQDVLEQQQILLFYKKNKKWTIIGGNQKHYESCISYSGNLDEQINLFVKTINSGPDFSLLKTIIEDIYKSSVEPEKLEFFSLTVKEVSGMFGFFLVFSGNKLLNKADLHLLQACQKQISYILHIHYLQDLSNVDVLTGLFNRRYMDGKLDYELRRRRRKKTNLSILLLDIDFFKQVNDTHGHTKGDEVLEELGLSILSSIREIDIPCRYGGEEFLIILPDTDNAGANILAKRIKNKIASLVFQSKEKFSVTVSIGISTIGEDSVLNSEEFIQQADKALYSAKNAGRNQIINFKTEK